MALHLVVHGRGNAWPVPLGDTHPFYDKNNPKNLSNAAFSLVASDHDKITADVLIDAGHGTIQSLITGSNRIPDCISQTAQSSELYLRFIIPEAGQIIPF